MTSVTAADLAAPEIAKPAEALCLPDTDWLQHRLTISGPVEELSALPHGGGWRRDDPVADRLRTAAGGLVPPADGSSVP